MNNQSTTTTNDEDVQQEIHQTKLRQVQGVIIFSGPDFTDEEWEEATRRIEARGTPRRCSAECGCEEEAEIWKMREEAGDPVPRPHIKSTRVNPQHDE